MLFNAPDITKLLLDLPHCLEIRSPIEGVSSHKEKFDEVPARGNVSISDIQPSCEKGKGITIVHRHNVSNTISRVYDYSGSQAYKMGLYNVNQPVGTYTESHTTLRV